MPSLPIKGMWNVSSAANELRFPVRLSLSRIYMIIKMVHEDWACFSKAFSKTSVCVMYKPFTSTYKKFG